MKILKKADLEETRATLIDKINAQADEAASQFITPTNLAHYMYRLKQQEAKKFYRYGSETDMPLLSEEAKLRDIPLPQLVQEIEQKQATCDNALKSIELTRQQALLAAKQANTIADLHKAAKVDWQVLDDMREKEVIEPVFDFISRVKK